MLEITETTLFLVCVNSTPSIIDPEGMIFGSICTWELLKLFKMYLYDLNNESLKLKKD